MFSFLRRAQSRVGQAQINQGSFTFRGNPGHDYDLWSWPYQPAASQYTYFNAIPGNALPSFNKFVQHPATLQQIQPSWQMPSNSEQPNAWIRGNSALQALRFGQNQSAMYIARQSAAWQTLYYNGGVD
jgi:hypothetical protein